MYILPQILNISSKNSLINSLGLNEILNEPQ